MTIERVPAGVLADIGEQLRAAAEQVQDNIEELGLTGEARDTAIENAQDAADRAHERLDLVEQTLASWPTGGSTGGGGYGPDTFAGANIPDSERAAVLAAGGKATTNQGDDAQQAQSIVNEHGRLSWVGQLRLNKTITPPARRMIVGLGPAAEVVGLAGLSGAFFLSTHDHNWYADFTISGGAEAAGTHHIHTNLTDQDGFSTGADGCTIIERVVSRRAKGRPFIVEGYNNRDAKIRDLHAWDAANGILLNSPDGRAHDIVAGTCGGNAGIELGTGSANWHVSGKSWYSEGDGVRAAGVRHTLIDIEGQDNRRAGIRLVGNLLQLDDWTADSNSYWSSSPTPGWHSGLELGLLPATGAGVFGTASGGYNLTIGQGQAWDKMEGGRARNQRFGVVARSGIRNLIMFGVNTGASATDSHANLIDGIKFLTASDLNHPSNYVTGCSSHGVRVYSV